MASLTLSGGYSFDADGLAIWEGTTNEMPNSHAASNVSNWAGSSATITRLTTGGPDDDHPTCIQVDTPGSVAFEGVAASTATGKARAAGQPEAGQIKIKGPVGATIDVWVRCTNLDSSITEGAKTTITCDGTWQDAEPVVVKVATGKTGDWYSIFARTHTAQAITFYVSAAQLENQPLQTPLVFTDGGTASRSAARAQAPASLLDETQGWIAIRIRTGFPSSTSPHGSLVGFSDWRDDNNSRILLDYDPSTTEWELRRQDDDSPTAAVVSDTFAQDDYITVTAAWTATEIKLSVDGAAFVSEANSSIPVLAQTLLELGSVAGISLQADSDFVWVATGTGTLTDADAGTIDEYGNTPPDPADLPAASVCTAVMPMTSASILTEGFPRTSPGNDTPRYRIEAAFDTNPAADPTWTDITGYVREFSIRRGRQHELDRVAAGELVATLDNNDARFDPTNTSSPYTPNVRPMRRIRARARWNNVDYNLFHGYAEAWTPTWQAGGLDSIVTVTAADLFKVLTLHELVGRSYPSQATGARMGTVLVDVGFGTAAVNLDGGQSTLAASGTLTSTKALEHLLSVAESENGLFFADAGGTPVFQGRHHRILNESASSGTIGDTSGALRYNDARTSYDDSQIWNQVRVTPASGTAETAVDPSSTARYFTRTLDRSYLISSQNEAFAASQYLLSRFSEPSLRIPQVTIVGARDTTTWPTVLGREFSDRVTFVRHHPSGGTIMKDEYVEGIQHSVQKAGEWLVSFDLSPADLQAYWVLDDPVLSVLGTSTRPAY